MADMGRLLRAFDESSPLERADDEDNDNMRRTTGRYVSLIVVIEESISCQALSIEEKSVGKFVIKIKIAKFSQDRLTLCMIIR